METKKILNITSGDIAGGNLAKSGLPGEILVWHDILYEETRQSGWPNEEDLERRAFFLESYTGGGLNRIFVKETLNKQYADLKGAKKYDSVLLFFDACLFDQSMLCHILTCAKSLKLKKMELLCIDSFPTISPYHGIGQLSPEQIASVYNKRQTLTDSQYIFAEQVDKAFAAQDPAAFDELVNMHEAPLPWVPAAIKRWIEEMPDKISGLGRLEHLILEALQNGKSSPWEIYSYVSALETPPQYWGDTTLWLKINGLADRNPPLIKIEGPHPRLPQWKGTTDLKLFKVVVV